MKAIKTILVLVGTSLALSSAPASAAPIPCVTNTLEAYLGLGADGCTVGDTVFLGFGTFAVPGTSTVAPDMVTVTPFGTSLTPGFTFSGPFAATAGDLFGLGLVYTAQGNVVGNQAALVGSSALADGIVTLIESKCLGESFDADACAAATAALSLFTEETAGNSSGAMTFSNQPTVGIRNQLIVDGGATGSSSLEAFSNAFSAVPEPSAFWLFGLGVAGLAAVRRRAAR